MEASATPLQPGYLVESFEGRKIGTVLEVRSEHLLLKPPHRRPFWVARVLVRSVDGQRVRLHVDRRTLARYRDPCGPARPADVLAAGRVPFQLACGLAAVGFAAIFVAMV